MKCECGKEFTGNFCPNCGKPAMQPSAGYAVQPPVQMPATVSHRIRLLKQRLLSLLQTIQIPI